eukprot:2642484-Pyramimonas_sp.AAC.1
MAPQSSSPPLHCIGGLRTQLPYSTLQHRSLPALVAGCLFSDFASQGSGHTHPQIARGLAMTTQM